MLESPEAVSSPTLLLLQLLFLQTEKELVFKTVAITTSGLVLQLLNSGGDNEMCRGKEIDLERDASIDWTLSLTSLKSSWSKWGALTLLNDTDFMGGYEWLEDRSWCKDSTKQACPLVAIGGHEIDDDFFS